MKKKIQLVELLLSCSFSFTLREHELDNISSRAEKLRCVQSYDCRGGVRLTHWIWLLRRLPAPLYVQRRANRKTNKIKLFFVKRFFVFIAEKGYCHHTTINKRANNTVESIRHKNVEYKFIFEARTIFFRILEDELCAHWAGGEGISSENFLVKGSRCCDT